MSKNNKHTPGPWIARPDPNTITTDDWCIGIEGSIDKVAVCSACDGHLIAAAPELLAALQRARDYISASIPTVAESLANPDTGLIDSGEGLLTIGLVYELIAQIEASIAKATGEQE